MAMIQRGGGGGGGAPRRGARTGGVQRVYKDFSPTTEWKQDDKSHILNVHLPGFIKEQIKVSIEEQNIIMVCGERLVADNNWSHFREDFQVPENGEMNSVHAKLQGGILAITVPKKEADKPHGTLLTPKPKSNDVQKQPATIKDQDKVFPEASTSQPAGEKSTQQSQKASSNDYTRERDQRNDAEKERSEPKEKNIASDRRDGLLNKEREKNAVGTKEIPEKTELEKDGATGIPENKADNKELYTKEKYKKAVKGLAELNEERQLLVNMGVAMLVVVALTAYVTFKFGVSGKDKN